VHLTFRRMRSLDIPRAQSFRWSRPESLRQQCRAVFEAKGAMNQQRAFQRFLHVFWIVLLIFVTVDLGDTGAARADDLALNWELSL
jgi:hypothetical protein